MEDKKRVLFIVNLEKKSSKQIARHAICSFFKNSQHFIIYSEDKTAFPQTQIYSKEHKIDCVVVIGENCTLLRAFSIFAFKDSPAIVGIADGCEPILFNYSNNQVQDLLELLIPEVLTNNIVVQNCMKLQMISGTQSLAQATCQIEFSRGIYQSVLKINLYLINQCSGEPIKIGQLGGDGLLISTPMGSFCKSMSLNGPLMHKEMENILIIPVCPLSLKFRPLCLPSTTQLLLQIDEQSRSPGFIYIDNTDSGIVLAPGQKIKVCMSKHKIRMASSILVPYDQKYIEGLKQILNWGELYQSKQYFKKDSREEGEKQKD